MPHSSEYHPQILQQANTCLLIIDVQEKFRHHIENFEEITKNIVILSQVANKLNLPVIVSEQYPQGLGTTVKEISAVLTGYEKITKSTFSCCQEDDFVNHLKNLKRKQILATGIESHVCVSQTVHGLLDLGYQTHLVVDAIGSRRSSNKDIGIKKMLTAGATISSTEMAIFELIKTSAIDEFKYIQGLLK